MIPLLTEFAPVIYGITTWYKVEVLVVGAILAPGKRTVSASLRTMGLQGQVKYGQYHHVLKRARWSGLEASQALLKLLLKTLAKPGEALVFGIEETIERRRGEKITAKGIYRDPVRSSHNPFVNPQGCPADKASGWRWIRVMWLTAIPWAKRIGGLPFLTILAPSERSYATRTRPHKRLTDWARQAVYQGRRWLPDVALILVGDSTYAALEFLAACQQLPNPVTVITRLRMDAALYEPAPPYRGKGRPRKKGQRLPTPQQQLSNPQTVWTRRTLPWYGNTERVLELASFTAVWFHDGLPPVPIRYVLSRAVAAKFPPQCLLATDPTLTPTDMLAYFIRRWQMETTFQQVRTHLGVETQRQWSEKAILRTTPALLGLFSLVTLCAQVLVSRSGLHLPKTAWYSKSLPTFSDALALVRSHLWTHFTFQISATDPDMIKVPKRLLLRFHDLLCYAA